MAETAYDLSKPYPLGSTWDGKGVNFALYAENAESVELCLFDSLDDCINYRNIRIREMSHNVWHIHLPDVLPGQLYGYRVRGPFDPAKGFRFNPNKLLMDPYAKAFAGDLIWNDAVFGYEIGHPDADLSFSQSDSAPYIPKSVVVDPAFDWENDKPPDTPYYTTVIYEAHVKGLTIKKPDIPEEIRGSYSAIASPVMIGYLQDLGVTAIELMPVHYFISDRSLVEKGLTNYWGYNTIGYFSPDNRYAASRKHSEQVSEFKQMVKALHKAGIEVILDVVYNHTAEGNQMGPTLSFKGIDNTGYYRLTEDKRYYMDYTGTGNTLNTMTPNVLRLIMDSLRYWITEMHVDGFRFDLASTLARELHEVDRLSAFFDIIHQDPVISQVKLIAEPWDVGEGGYQVGKFPPEWAEWNGMYRDAVRDFWRGEEHKLPEFAARFTGSADLYKDDLRRPTASINFITAHDGFTLTDLVSYNEKHNEANKDNNTDGESHNRSNNWGAEGPTDDPGIHAIRQKIKRNFIATLFLSQGVPMLLAGDETGNTQHGNNNSYCQDNELSWINWEAADPDLLRFFRQTIAFRKAHPVFSRRRWFKGTQSDADGLKDIAWFSPEGKEMSEEQWNEPSRKTMGVFYNGLGLRSLGPSGDPVVDDDFFIIFNAGDKPVSFTLPPEKFGRIWEKQIDTNASDVVPAQLEAAKPVEVEAYTMVILKADKKRNKV